MSNTDQSWKIRILSGLHAGAELVLPDEPTTLGRGEDCDLALDDAQLAERHIELTPVSGRLRLRLLDASSAAHVDGKAVEGEIALAPFQIVTIGGIHLAVAPAREEWPRLDTPIVQAATEEEPAAETALMGEQVEGGQGGQDRGEPEEEPDPQRRDAPQPAPASRRTRRQAQRHFALFAVGAAALIVAAILWLGGPKEVERRALDAGRLQDAVDDLAGRLGAQVTVTMSEDPALPPKVTGFSRFAQDQVRFENGLREAGIHAITHLTPDSEILHAVMVLINQVITPGSGNALEVVPSGDSPGHMVISGYVENAATLNRLRQLVESEVRRHRGFTYSVQTQADREAILHERLARLQLVEALHVQQLDNGIALFGPAPGPAKLAELTGLVEDFNQEFDSKPNLTLPGTTSFLGKSTIELDYRALIIEDDQYHIITHSGTAQTNGGLIMGDWIISTIDPRYVILERAPELKGSENNGQRQSKAYFIVKET